MINLRSIFVAFALIASANLHTNASASVPQDTPTKHYVLYGDGTYVTIDFPKPPGNTLRNNVEQYRDDLQYIPIKHTYTCTQHQPIYTQSTTHYMLNIIPKNPNSAHDQYSACYALHLWSTMFQPQTFE